MNFPLERTWISSQLIFEVAAAIVARIEERDGLDRLLDLTQDVQRLVREREVLVRRQIPALRLARAQHVDEAPECR